jgi:tetratricopeptide (TPR) repeat protein
LSTILKGKASNKAIYRQQGIIYKYRITNLKNNKSGNLEAQLKQFNAGLNHFFDEDCENAAVQFHDILEKYPSNDAAHYYLGIVYRLQRKLEKAALHFEKALELNTTDEWIFIELLLTFIAAKRFDEAISILCSTNKITNTEWRCLGDGRYFLAGFLLL